MNLYLLQIEQNLARVSTTVSIGVAEYPKNGITIKEPMSAADQALYEGKENGRDRVVTATSRSLIENTHG